MNKKGKVPMEHYNIGEFKDVYKRQMHNQLVPEQPDIPQTGDSSNLPLIYVGLTAAGAGSLLLILTLYHRKKSIKGSNK